MAKRRAAPNVKKLAKRGLEKVEPEPAHVLIRVKSEGGQTFTEHGRMIKAKGAALLGKIGQRIGPEFVKELNSQIDAGAATSLFLTTREGWNGPYVTYRCKLARVHETLPSGKKDLAPKYYAESYHLVEVHDKNGVWRVVLCGESKHQGNDVANVAAGERTSVMAGKGQYIMPAGNAIERVHKNIQEMKNLMLGEKHFPYVVLLQGSNFAIEAMDLRWPDGTLVPLSPGDAGVNRIDRVTAANYGMDINKDYCRNIVVAHPSGSIMLQVTSIYAQCDHFTAEQMRDILWNTALTSLEVLADDLP